MTNSVAQALTRLKYVKDNLGYFKVGQENQNYPIGVLIDVLTELLEAAQPAAKPEPKPKEELLYQTHLPRLANDGTKVKIKNVLEFNITAGRSNDERPLAEIREATMATGHVVLLDHPLVIRVVHQPDHDHTLVQIVRPPER